PPDADPALRARKLLLFKRRSVLVHYLFCFVIQMAAGILPETVPSSPEKYLTIVKPFTGQKFYNLIRIT
ncbi:hypothetical protein, partial [Enterobacter hormaechei]|uniref:hypothetical protein n=1 Tax=Enterobacter hormaechei TaxID=158836 RepID=UPI001ADFEAF1